MRKPSKASSQSTAQLSQRFANVPWKIACRSERKLYALQNWMRTSDTKVIVIASRTSNRVASAQLNSATFTSADQHPPSSMRTTTGREKMPDPAVWGRGGIHRQGECRQPISGEVDIENLDRRERDGQP